MAATMEQALSAREFHDESLPCNGKRSNRWRRTGATKVWKTRPTEFKVPVAHGLYSHGYITQNNIEHFHTELNCPESLTPCERMLIRVAAGGDADSADHPMPCTVCGAGL